MRNRWWESTSSSVADHSSVADVSLRSEPDDEEEDEEEEEEDEDDEEEDEEENDDDETDDGYSE